MCDGAAAAISQCTAPSTATPTSSARRSRGTTHALTHQGIVGVFGELGQRYDEVDWTPHRDWR